MSVTVIRNYISDGLIEVVSEEQILADGQTVVNFDLPSIVAAGFYICGDNADNGRLCDDEFTVDGVKQITLAQSYPAGTIVQALLNEPIGSDTTDHQTVYDTVDSMKIANIPIGALVETIGYYVEGDGGQGSYLIEAFDTNPDGYGDHLLANGNVAVLQPINGVINVKQYGAAGDGLTDEAPFIQAVFDSVIPTNTVLFPDGEYLINTQVENFVDNIHIDFAKSVLLNTVEIPLRIENSQGITPVFFIKANDCSATGGLWLDFVSEGMYFGGVLNGGDPYDNDFYGVNVWNMRCERLINANYPSKFIQTRHIDDVDIRHIFCLDMGKAVAGKNAQSVSVNYSTNARIESCTVENCLEGSAFNMLYVKHGHMKQNTATGIQNSLDPAINVAGHIKFSIDVEISGNSFQTIDGECIKVSEGVTDVIVANNTLITTGSDAGIFTVLQLQGVNGFNVTGNIIITDGPRAIYCTVHVSESTKDGNISGNKISRNVAALQPTSKGSGIWIVSDVSDRAPITISDNYLYECDIYCLQMADSHINNNNFSITTELFYNGFDHQNNPITQISTPITLESCTNTNSKDNSIINTVTDPAGFQVGLRLINSVFCNIVTNHVVFSSGALLSYAYADLGSNSSIFIDNTSTNDIGYVQDINNPTPAKHFYKRTVGFSADIGTVSAGGSVQDTMVIEMMQISNGNTFLTTKASLPSAANGLLYEAIFTANNTVTFTFFNPTGGDITPGLLTYYLTSERAPT